MESEQFIHSQCFLFYHNHFPSLRGLLCLNFNNSLSARDGNRQKAMGRIAGYSDMSFYYHGKAYFIEFKTPIGVQSKEQKQWQSLVESHGFHYIIIRSLLEFMLVILTIIIMEEVGE